MKFNRMLFIINPISGFAMGKEVPQRIKKINAYDSINYTIRFTEYAGHAKFIVKEAIKEGYDYIIAVGGDGTVNEVGTALVNTGVTLGIISLGSGNGFARHLGYSLFINKALKQLLNSPSYNIDVVDINGLISLNVSGLGFDAEVAHHFNKMKIRGIFSYMYSIVKIWFRYSPKPYTLTIDGKEYQENCFILSIANSSQYGNNASIAPKASIRDGLLDVCILKKPRFYQIPRFLYCFMNSQIYKLNYFKEIQCKEAILKGDIVNAHIDGDPYVLVSPVTVKVCKSVLKAVVPKYA